MAASSRLIQAVQSCRARLLGFISNRVKVRDDAEDIMQDIVLRLFQTDVASDPVDDAVAWLFRAARNAITDGWRKKREEQLPAADADALDFTLASTPELVEITEVLCARTGTAEDTYLAGIFWQELRIALDALPDTQREIFVKTELENCSYKQLAEEMDIPIATLLSKKHKAVLRLRERLRKVYDAIINS
ncbi:MAG: RNA polymerase subunit sigma-24 [Candidatus Desulfovibrio kirbyi]|jgi:RNA polymerase sigma factor (sigma-70 family)|uniref:RNA polymerase subunit sigma-24 n=1 Tax=Candidatus Desulfovibrio kirbyi TaxID=2696086 RepID=A0A6L2R5L3_9BACT|nr:MAG: RNA polymerase subunit sigma-24 [Candidatus Desulfovibrio kirbyi]